MQIILQAMMQDDQFERVWTKKDGTVVPLNDMSNEHILNTLRMIVTRRVRMNISTMLEKETWLIEELQSRNEVELIDSIKEFEHACVLAKLTFEL